MIFFILSCIITTKAQTSSYNVNTVPIGGVNNVAFGVGTLTSNTGFRNIGYGSNALHSNTTGNVNLAIGTAALYSNLVSTGNIAIGDSAMFANSSGIVNVALGNLALRYNVSGYQNAAIGDRALFSNENGLNNTAINSMALFSNISGSQNTAIGVVSLYSNQTGGSNTAIGNASLFNNKSSRNVAVGVNVLLNNTIGSQNTAVGTWAMQNNLSGSYNAAYGHNALIANASGNNNVAIGDSAGYQSLGSGNIYLGKRAGYNEISDNKIYIANDSNKTILYGDLATGQILLGNSEPTGYIFKGTRSLNVLGGILTDSLRVALSSSWADYVFSNQYNLMSLKELEEFIKINKHLPNIPSDAEVKANGVEVATTQIKLLEKIEELTLYILQQQKEIEEQKTNNAKLRKEVDEIKAQLKVSKLSAF